MFLAPVDIVIDSRENSKHPEFRESFVKEGLKVSIQELPAGDFLLIAPPDKRSILVERKTIDDLANSIRDNRLWEQSEVLMEIAKRDGHKPLLLIEGSFTYLERYRGWKIQSILRAIDTLVLDLEIPVLYAPHKEATIAWLIAKAKSLGSSEGKRLMRLRVEKKPMSLNDRILYVAESVAGPLLARKLLKKFSTLRNIANASIYELMMVEGIGEKRAHEIYAIFNTQWREEVI
ncbi:MAG: ERCC4 domain-containing protein [Desulfurococcaceae archaeon]